MSLIVTEIIINLLLLLCKIQQTHYKSQSSWNMMNSHSCSSQTDCTNNFSIPKLSENSPFQVADIIYSDRNNYQVTFTFM